MSPRQAAVTILLRVLKHGDTLTSAFSRADQITLASQERSFTRELCFGVLRWFPRLDAILGQLIKRPLRNKDLDIQVILLLGIYQLEYTRVPPYAAVAETVSLAGERKKTWGQPLINAVLRRFQRERGTLLHSLEQQPRFVFAHPEWMIQAFRSAWPRDWEWILEQNNHHAPMTLRVNSRRLSRDNYLEILYEQGLAAEPTTYSPHGIRLTQATPVTNVPQFAQGMVSVQDEAAQLAAHLLGPRSGQRVLDACAAPGGKTAHILESTPGLREVVAIDHDPQRQASLTETLSRLGLTATVVTGDAASPIYWWDHKPFDRILIDAPCSATGVIRRHPDIKVLRQKDQFPVLYDRQDRLLRALWPLLARGGTLLYATCSTLPQENEGRIERLTTAFQDVQVVPIEAEWGRRQEFGRQILPGENEMDGFYFALLKKTD